MPYKNYYCAKCDEIVGEQKFCTSCGQSTNNRVQYICENGHNVTRWDNFCKECGSKEIQKI